MEAFNQQQTINVCCLEVVRQQCLFSSWKQKTKIPSSPLKCKSTDFKILDHSHLLQIWSLNHSPLLTNDFSNSLPHTLQHNLLWFQHPLLTLLRFLMFLVPIILLSIPPESCNWWPYLVKRKDRTELSFHNFTLADSQVLCSSVL